MPDLDVIATAIDFIEDNLKEPLTVAAIAEAVNYSQFYFCRLFNQVTHHTPYEYLILRRLSEAARSMLQTDAKIIEIALDYQFNNPETFSRAFKRAFGLQPIQLRRQGYIDQRRLMPKLTLAHLEHIYKGQYLKPVLVDKPTIHLKGLMSIVRDDLAIISALWEMLDQELAQIKHLAPWNYYGILDYTPKWEKQGFFYMASVELQESDIDARLLVSRIIPAMQYVRILHKGNRRNLQMTLDYAYHTWTLKTNRSLCYQFYMEHFREMDDEEDVREIFIPLAV